VDEQRKQQLLISFIAFNLVVILYQLAFNSGLFHHPFAWSKMLLSLVLGLVAAGIAFGAVRFLQR
jgi:hypothetical protein